MRIALLSPRSEIHTVRWANALAMRGHTIHLLSSHNEENDPLHKDVHLHRLKIPSPVGYFGNSFCVRRLLRNVSPDILHAHYATGYGTLGRLSRYNPYVLSVWGNDVYEFPNRSFVHRRFLRKNLVAADHICSTSNAMAEQTYRVVNHDLSLMHVVPFGVDLDKFRPLNSAPDSVKGNPIVVGTVKKLEDKYGIDILLKSFLRVQQHLKETNTSEVDLRLLIVGDGPERKALERLSQQLGIADVTSFVGSVPHSMVPYYLAKLDVYVAVSRYESFGVAVIEASACQRPVVVSDVGGLPEVVRHGKTGFVVPNEDSEATAEAIEQLVLDPARRRAMGQAGRRHVEERYAWHTCVDQMERIYNHAIE